MKLSNEIEQLLEQRYYQPGETWPDLVDRVATHIMGDSELLDDIRNDLLNRVWLPNSPCMVNSGLKNGGLMACFVVGPEEDTLENHVAVLGDIAAVGKRGGGCGFTGTFIRPKDSPVSGSAHGYAYGPNAWALRVSDYLDMITQGGFRKMALMYSIDAAHDDLDDFISLKQTKDEGFAYNFNQSVFASDEWMRSAITGVGKQSRQLATIAENAWNNGEPGLLFSDTINNNTPYTTCGCKIYTTNPCGEQPLPSYGSCNLGSINISHDVFFADGEFDFGALEAVVSKMTIFLDAVGSKNVFPNEMFAEWYMMHRPIGIGIMGYADALLRLGYPYGDEGALWFLDKVMKTIREESYIASEWLGKKLGVPEHCKGVGRRNITTVSIAPTGSIAFLAGCSHGIEPVFSPVFKRTDERGNEYIFRHPLANEPYFRSSVNGKVPTWREHVETQATAQLHCDSAISKTINFPNGDSVEDIKNAIIYAWELGCKGITAYRDGSRQFQVLEDITEADAAIIDCPTGVCNV